MKKSFKIIITFILIIGIMPLVRANIGNLTEATRNNSSEIEVNSIVEKPEVISNIEDIYQMNRTEVYPDLSTSSIKANKSQMMLGDPATFTVNILNTGNVDASDIDVFIEINESFDVPSYVNFSGCGGVENYETEENLEISNITVKKDNNCLVTFELRLQNDDLDQDVVNSLYLSPASEGGVEIGPIHSSGISVRKPENAQLSEPIVESGSEPANEPVTDSATESAPEQEPEPQAADENQPSEPLEPSW